MKSRDSTYVSSRMYSMHSSPEQQNMLSIAQQKESPVKINHVLKEYEGNRTKNRTNQNI